MQPEIEPPAFQLIVDPLYLLSYSHQVGLSVQISWFRIVYTVLACVFLLKLKN